MEARDARRAPLRTCVVCRRVRPKSSMVRLVREPDGSVSVDRSGKAPGRGAYVCGEAECVRRAPERLGRMLRAKRVDLERVRRDLNDLTV